MPHARQQRWLLRNRLGSDRRDDAGRCLPHLPRPCPFSCRVRRASILLSRCLYARQPETLRRALTELGISCITIALGGFVIECSYQARDHGRNPCLRTRRWVAARLGLPLTSHCLFRPGAQRALTRRYVRYSSVVYSCPVSVRRSSVSANSPLACQICSMQVPAASIHEVLMSRSRSLVVPIRQWTARSGLGASAPDCAPDASALACVSSCGMAILYCACAFERLRAFVHTDRRGCPTGSRSSLRLAAGGQTGQVEPGQQGTGSYGRTRPFPSCGLDPGQDNRTNPRHPI